MARLVAIIHYYVHTASLKGYLSRRTHIWCYINWPRAFGRRSPSWCFFGWNQAGLSGRHANQQPPRPADSDYNNFFRIYLLWRETPAVMFYALGARLVLVFVVSDLQSGFLPRLQPSGPCGPPPEEEVLLLIWSAEVRVYLYWWILQEKISERNILVLVVSLNSVKNAILFYFCIFMN